MSATGRAAATGPAAAGGTGVAAPPVGAVVTGIGVVTANGVGVERFWANTLAGRVGLGPISRFEPAGYPARLAGEVDDAALVDVAVPQRLAVQTDRWTGLALAAATLALADAGIDPAGPPPFDGYDIAAITASSSGGNEFGQREISRLWQEGPRGVSVYQSIAWFYAATTGQLSIRHGLRGPCGVLVGEQAGGLDAIAQSRRVLRSGTRAVLTGGTEAPLSPYALVCQGAGGMLHTGADPAHSYRPFAADADGYVPGEGGALLLLEEESSAQDRNARVYGRVAGHAATFDPAPGSGRPSGLLRAAQGALTDAGLAPRDVDVVFADGLAVPGADEAEAAVLRRLFGPRGVPVTVPQAMTGRLAAGGGSLDVACALLAMRDSVIPPTASVTAADRYGLDLVTGEARAARLHTALVLARGYGGFNSALVLTSDH